MTASSRAANEIPTPWLQLPAAALDGEGLNAYVEGEIANLFDWVENLEARSEHLMPHRGQFIVDIVEIDANAVHQPSKPGDEVVVVLNGILRLTTDADGDVQDILAGEAVLIPAGWAGLYRVIGERGRFRELAIVPRDYFDPGVAPPPNDKRPLRLDFPSAPGRHQLHRGRYEVEMVDLATAERGSVTTSSEEIIRVLAGTLKLIAGGASQTFAAGSVLVLPVDFHGDAETSAGYRSMNLRWIG